MTADDLIRASRVPDSVQPGTFWPWTIVRRTIPADHPDAMDVGFRTMTSLHRMTMATLHLPLGDVVMEDSRRELRRHLPILLVASGKILISGLGLGCVVRGLLANPCVSRVDVMELCPRISRIIGREFSEDPRVRIVVGDALKIRWPRSARWDFAWHDIWTEDGNGVPLHRLHLKLMFRYKSRIGRQGAWALPREIKKVLGNVLG